MKPLVLCYHAVSASWDDALAVTPRDLALQLRLLAVGRRPGTAADVLAGRHVVHATFDDAFVSFGESLPLLERAQLPVTLFACSGYGDGRPLQIDALAGDRFDGEAMRTHTIDELRKLVERGVEVGSHTISHLHLSRLDDAELDRELRDSKLRLEDELARPCRYLAYPYGDQDGRVRAAARRAGYEAAFGLPGIRGDRFAIPRVGIYRRDRALRSLLKVATRRFHPEG